MACAPTVGLQCSRTCVCQDLVATDFCFVADSALERCAEHLVARYMWSVCLHHYDGPGFPKLCARLGRLGLPRRRLAKLLSAWHASSRHGGFTVLFDRIWRGTVLHIMWLLRLGVCPNNTGMRGIMCTEGIINRRTVDVRVVSFLVGAGAAITPPFFVGKRVERWFATYGGMFAHAEAQRKRWHLSCSRVAWVTCVVMWQTGWNRRQAKQARQARKQDQM